MTKLCNIYKYMSYIIMYNMIFKGLKETLLTTLSILNILSTVQRSKDGCQSLVYLVLIDTPYPDDGVSACCEESI